MNKKMAPGFDEKIPDLALDSVIGGTSALSRDLTKVSTFFTDLGDDIWDQMQGAYDFMRAGGYEAEGKIQNLFDSGSGDHALSHEGDYYNKMTIEGLNAQLDAHGSKTIEVLGGIATAGIMSIAGAATLGGVAYVGESIFSTVADHFSTETTAETLLPRNEALNTLIGQLSENAQRHEGQIHGIDGADVHSAQGRASVGDAVNSVKFTELVDEVASARLREMMNEKEPGAGDRVFAALEKHANGIMSRHSDLVVDPEVAMRETIENLLKDTDGSLAREMHLPSNISETLLMIKAQTVMLFSGMRELSEEAHADVQDGLGSALSHHGGSWINHHPVETWDPPASEPAFTTLENAINRNGGTQELGSMSEVLWNRNIHGIESETGTVAHQIATRDGLNDHDVLAAVHAHADSLVNRFVGDKVGELVQSTGQIFHDYLTEKNDVAPTSDEVRDEIVRQIEAGDFGLLRAGIDQISDVHTRQTLLGDARQIKFHYEQMRANELDRIIRDGNNHYTRVPEQPNPLEGHNLGHLDYYDGEGLMTLHDRAGTSEFRFKGYDVQKILEDDATRHMPTSNEVSLNEIQRQYSPQIDLLRARGVINEVEVVKIYTALQHIGEDKFEVARFKIDSEQYEKVGREDGLFHRELRSQEIVLRSPTYASELPKLTEIQRFEATEWTDHYSRVESEPGWSGPAARAGIYIGGVGTMMADLLSMVQANEGEHEHNLPGMDDRESGLAYVSANHEALVRALNAPGESHDDTSILNNIREFARAESVVHVKEADKVSTQVELEMYNVVDLLVQGKLSASDVRIPESFVEKLQQERASALEAINHQTRIATTAAIDQLTEASPQIAHQLEGIGKGSTAEEKKIDAAERILSGEYHLTPEQQHFVDDLKSERESIMSEMPETALIAGMEENQQKVPIGIGLKPEQLAGVARVDRLLQEQDQQLEHLHLSPDETAQYYTHVNMRVLVELESAGHHIPNSLMPLLGHASSGHAVMSPVAESEILGYLASTALAGDLHKHGAAEKETFLQQFFETREQVLATDPPPQH